MKCSRSLWFLAVLLFPGILMGSVHIRGNVKGGDGKPPLLAHIHLSSLGDHYSEPLQTVQVKEDGAFQIKVGEPGLYKLWVTAVNHRVLGIPLVLEQGDAPVKMNIHLNPYSYKSSFDEVKIIGGWNNYKFSSPEPMQKQPDGTFVYEVEAKADTVGYQLLGIVEEARSVNGTQADYYVYDGGGDYRSVLRAKRGVRVRIVFEPAKLLRVDNPKLPVATFEPPYAHFDEYFEITRRFESAEAAFFKAYQAYKEEHGDTKDFTFDFSELQSFLEEKMYTAENPELRQFAALFLAQLATRRWDLPDATFRNILELVPPSSPLWAVNAYLPVLVSHNVDKENADSLLQVFYDQNPSRKVQAQVLANLTMQADREGNKERVQALYGELKSKYGDVGDIQFYLKLLDPDRKIVEGKPVPEFHVKLMGSEESLSNKDLLGKYYLLDFWAVWCGPCVAEMPNLHEAHKKFKDKNFTLISLSFDAKPEDVQKFRQGKWPMPWLHVFVEGGFNSELAKNFEIYGIPKPILVNAQGIIVATNAQLRGENLQKTLAKLLGEPDTN